MNEDLTTEELKDILDFLDGYMTYVESCSVCDKIREKIKKMLEKK
jgi:hypothetical protein